MTSMTDPKLRTPLISEMIKELHLKPDSPYPTQKADAERRLVSFREAIKAYRRSQEHMALKEVK